MSLELTDLARRPDLYERVDEEISGHWPEFMLHDPVAHQNWKYLIEDFAEFQLIFLEGEKTVAAANALPFRWEKASDELPEEGWDWVFREGVQGLKNGTAPNCLAGLQIVVMKDYQGAGHSAAVVTAMMVLAKRKGFGRLLVPVRPTFKHKYPLIDIAEYVSWRRGDGLPFDPWLRVHARLGGRIVKPCRRAMRIEGSFGEWEKWTGMAFPAGGDYVVPGALVPVKADRRGDRIEYVEPNVWVEHDLR